MENGLWWFAETVSSITNISALYLVLTVAMVWSALALIRPPKVHLVASLAGIVVSFLGWMLILPSFSKTVSHYEVVTSTYAVEGYAEAIDNLHGHASLLVGLGVGVLTVIGGAFWWTNLQQTRKRLQFPRRFGILWVQVAVVTYFTMTAYPFTPAYGRAFGWAVPIVGMALLCASLIFAWECYMKGRTMPTTAPVIEDGELKGVTEIV